MTQKLPARRPAGRPSAPDIARVNAAILQAAAEVFAAKGFAAASMSEISARAGATRQTLYARFPNKTTLYEALAEARTNALLSNISLVLSNDEGDPQDVLQAFGEQLLQQFISSDMQRLHRMVISEAATFPNLAAYFFEKGPDRGRAILVSYLNRQVNAGTLNIADIETAAEQFVGALVGSVVIRSTLLRPPHIIGRTALRKWVQAAVRLFVSAYQSNASR